MRNINEKFEEDSDPISDLGIGTYAQIKKNLEEMEYLGTTTRIYNQLFRAYCIIEAQKLIIPIVRTIYHVLNRIIIRRWKHKIEDIYKEVRKEEFWHDLRYNDNDRFLIQNAILEILRKKYGIDINLELVNESFKNGFDHMKDLNINENLFVNKYKKLEMKRKKFIREDMGGVSTPISTPLNVPGVGNPTPAGPGRVGSGDKWGSTLNDKPYTQSGTLKKKKKDKKKKLEEENINPYDKLGMAMAKKMGVKLPFKKKKSKKNQNAMIQRNYEHQIITFNKFKNSLNEEMSKDEYISINAWNKALQTGKNLKVIFLESRERKEMTIKILKKYGKDLCDAKLINTTSDTLKSYINDELLISDLPKGFDKYKDFIIYYKDKSRQVLKPSLVKIELLN
jgi:hypothetical protein